MQGGAFGANRPRPIMLKILPIMLLSNAQRVTYYAQITTAIMPQFIYSFNIFNNCII